MLIKKLMPGFGQAVYSTVDDLTDLIDNHNSPASKEQERLDELQHPGVFTETDNLMTTLVDALSVTKDLLNAFMEHGYILSQEKPVCVDEGQTDVWVELEGYNQDWSDYCLWVYEDVLYGLDKRSSQDQQSLIILDLVAREQQKFERLTAKFSEEQLENTRHERTRIPETVRVEVWRRDQGRCASCGSREKLEYDHIVPVSRGGSNTARNVELLCEVCNRSKGDRIQ